MAKITYGPTPSPFLPFSKQHRTCKGRYTLHLSALPLLTCYTKCCSRFSAGEMDGRLPRHWSGSPMTVTLVGSFCAASFSDFPHTNTPSSRRFALELGKEFLSEPPYCRSSTREDQIRLATAFPSFLYSSSKPGWMDMLAVKVAAFFEGHGLQLLSLIFRGLKAKGTTFPSQTQAASRKEKSWQGAKASASAVFSPREGKSKNPL